MSINEKLNGIAEGVLDSLKTTEVQLPLFGIAWACAASWFPAIIPPSIDISWATQFVPDMFGTALPSAITPGWLIICLPIIVLAKTLTRGSIPFMPRENTAIKKETADA